jgi:hypothetical protein
MPIFHEQAIHAGAGESQDLSWLGSEHLADWPGLAHGFNHLSPEQRCDAIYLVATAIRVGSHC